MKVAKSLAIANHPPARKYKEYQRYRDIIDGKVPPPKADDATKKRKPMPPPVATPMKRAKHIETPTTRRFQQQAEEELSQTPQVSRKLFSPATVTSLGPTPQRDGRVLGLFDLLVERELGTPSKEEMGRRREVRGDVTGHLDVTPRKRLAESEEGTPRLGRTPMSSSKRQMLDNFMTPLKKKDTNAGGGTPSSVSKLQLETPQFLKRHALPTVDENGKSQFDMPAPLRLPRKPLGRGLSEIVASLRKDEEEKLDDDLEALREAEAGEDGPPPPVRKPVEEDFLVKDSQPGRPLLGGFDDEGLYDSPDEKVVGRDGNPLPVFKKKGQKRTTRKVNIKPVWKGRPTNTGHNHDEQDEEDVVPETQVAGDAAHPGNDLDADSDFEDELGTPSAPADAKKTASTKEGTGKKVMRKVNELAHANFRRLKLRNHGAKGGPGHNSKFRRRR